MMPKVFLLPVQIQQAVAIAKAACGGLLVGIFSG